MTQPLAGSCILSSTSELAAVADLETVTIFAIIYDQLRRLARNQMAREVRAQTLQPTALVHEAFLRLMSDAHPPAPTPGSYVVAASIAMRRILVERARRRARLRYGGDRRRLDLDPDLLASSDRPDQLLALDEALDRLGAFDPRKAHVVQLRYFGGLSIEETAVALGVSISTVKNDWAYARAWLLGELTSMADAGEVRTT